jgi:hypothetical protein
MTDSKKVLLLEFNEINWGVIDRLIAQRGASFLPNFARLRAEGAWAVQSAVERPPLLDPWITWVTLHTGVPPEVHGASVLEQSSETISAKRTWQYAIDAGRSVGVFGSISAYPPQPVKGFMVPGPFAPGNETFPPNLEPVQALNRSQTQAHAGNKKAPGLLANLRTGAALLSLGLRVQTLGQVAGQLLRERRHPGQRWQRVCLQPALNFDIFAAQYQAQRPDYATWHSNHAAHFMHHYWRAWDDSEFPAKASAEEKSQYGQAVPLGYQLCDELLGRAMALIDQHTVLVVASSMGQQPFVSDKYAKGKIVVRIKDIDALLRLVGREGITEVVPTMVPQWNLTIPDANRRAQVQAWFEQVTRQQGGESSRGFAVQATHEILTITPLGLARNDEAVVYSVPRADGSLQPVPLAELFAMDTPTVKQGMHHIDGLLAFYGQGVRPGVQLPACTNLDVAPTLLSLMDLPVPEVMPGQVLNVLSDQAGRAAAQPEALAA